ncbi:hypothetical protein [Sellimonas intestinalis]|uniref:hypothetical protein n=1 Tax=Sellimonas intestinalis TaxID=1653434 RepID=UPI0022E78F58|nr:hypothetical protein [Sellimonas intestinalis]
MTRKDAGIPSNITLMCPTPMRATMAATPFRYGRWISGTSSLSWDGYPTGLVERKAATLLPF